MGYIATVYVTEDGKSPFESWFNKLSSQAAAKITTAIARMETGNFSNSKSLKDGIWENKLHFGPGYRIYYGKEKNKILILLAGGTKNQQSADIAKAKKLWLQYKINRRKKQWH